MNKTRHILMAITAALTIALPAAASPAEVQKAEMAGYLLVCHGQGPRCLQRWVLALRRGLAVAAAVSGASLPDGPLRHMDACAV